MSSLIENKKILIVTEVFYPEEFKINDVAMSWKNRGYDVDVLTLEPTYPLGKVFPGYKNSFLTKNECFGINILRIRAVTGYRDSTFKKILKYLNFMFFGTIIGVFIGNKYDYIFGFNAGALTSMLPVVAIKKIFKKPVMVWVQDVWPDNVYAYGFKKTKIISSILNAFVKFFYHNVTSIAISSKGFESKLRPYVKKGMNFSYAPNWPDDLDMNVVPAVLSTTKKTHFTFAGNIGKVQNLENIIKAFSLLPEGFRQKAQLNIVGDGSNLIHLKKIATGSENVVFHGKIARKNMAKFFRASDFLIISLIDEPIFSATVPAKTQTYIAAKKPIMAIINGDVADIVSDNNLGISVSPSDQILIKNAFEFCIDMPKSMSEQFLTNNQKLLKSTFKKEHIINQLTIQLMESKF